MKVEIEVKAFGQEDVQETTDAFKAVEIARTHDLSKETTLGEVEKLMASLVKEIEKQYPNPEQCLGKATIRINVENGKMIFIG